MTRYTPTTDSDREAMLKEIGVASVYELFRDIPESVRFKGQLEIPEGRSELEVLEELQSLALTNVHCGREINFVGAGMYDHYVPACVDAIISRSEFQTSYTPYQPELSQGNLQAIFEFQTLISELVGLPVANASLYDGPTAAAEAAYLAKAETGRTKVIVSEAVSPQTRELLKTYSVGFGIEVVESPIKGGVTELAALAKAVDDQTAAVFIQQPNFLGAVEDLKQLSAVIKEQGALFVCGCDPHTLGILEPPGHFGADVAYGEGQGLGNQLSFGGPSFGFFAAAQEHIRRMPGRIAGETNDVDGRRGFVLTLQTREQHIRREKATSNICTNQALNALAGAVYLSWLGKRGIVELGELLLQRTAFAREQLSRIDGVELLNTAPVVREFAVKLDVAVEPVLEHCHRFGIAAGYPLGKDYSQYRDTLLVAITERRSRFEIEQLASVLSAAIAQVRSGAEATQ